ncbi:M23 family metallopeptidase [Agromyces atrinae]|uniref:Murein DD-endopeptidase MepM/ murein hydrolase activator NlpD n=1 Tax=Agromyces atrinae TaxID=592376 RepID=A0A852SKW5_9MICO|nr:M23 family metallopeptidase [Agromyces atrinae]NYD68289.1 murein DD-endopeptidase MepM/ murein hydrolase activator NlpD [Agromyces atrinae]
MPSALTALTLAALLSTGLGAPAHADEVEPTPTSSPMTSTPTPDPVTPSPSEPAPSPSPSPSPSPETPTPTPTPEPPVECPEPTDAASDATTDAATPPPTVPAEDATPDPCAVPETPTPTPTPTPTAPPAPPAQVAPPAAVPQTIRPTRPSTVNAAAVAARTRLTTALASLDTAKREYEIAVVTSSRAQQLLDTLEGQRARARADADDAAAVYITALRGGSQLAGLSDIDVVFRTGGDLLGGLGSLDRLTGLAEDIDVLAERAERTAARADELDDRAAAAQRTVDEAGLAAATRAVDAAEKAVEAARSSLAQAASTAAVEVSALIDLPLDSGQLSELGWTAPVVGRVTDGFGWRLDKPLANVNDFHAGTDIAAPCGTPIFAATGGTVVEARSFGTYGNWVLIDHGAGVSTGYAHILDGGTLVSVGDRVAAGQTIAVVGNTGASTGCHLHLELRLDGIAIDALPFFAARGVTLG